MITSNLAGGLVSQFVEVLCFRDWSFGDHDKKCASTRPISTWLVEVWSSPAPQCVVHRWNYIVQQELLTSWLGPTILEHLVRPHDRALWKGLCTLHLDVLGDSNHSCRYRDHHTRDIIQEKGSDLGHGWASGFIRDWLPKPEGWGSLWLK